MQHKQLIYKYILISKTGPIRSTIKLTGFCLVLPVQCIDYKQWNFYQKYFPVDNFVVTEQLHVIGADGLLIAH